MQLNTSIVWQLQHRIMQQQQQSGLSGEAGLYGTDLGASENALGLSNSALSGAASSQAQNPWMQLLTAGMQSGGQAAAGAGY